MAFIFGTAPLNAEGNPELTGAAGVIAARPRSPNIGPSGVGRPYAASGRNLRPGGSAHAVPEALLVLEEDLQMPPPHVAADDPADIRPVFEQMRRGEEVVQEAIALPQVSELLARVARWTGNDARDLQFTAAEVETYGSTEPVIRDVLKEGLTVGDRDRLRSTGARPEVVLMPRTRECDGAVRSGRLRKAASFLSAADIVRELGDDDLTDAIVTNCILAGCRGATVDAPDYFTDLVRTSQRS